MPLHPQVHQNIIQIYGLLLGIVIPSIFCVICTYLVKEPYYISILSGQDWVQKLIHIRCELEVHKHVFWALLETESTATGQHICLQKLDLVITVTQKTVRMFDTFDLFIK